jgi:hypothetical protein
MLKTLKFFIKEEQNEIWNHMKKIWEQPDEFDLKKTVTPEESESDFFS